MTQTVSKYCNNFLVTYYIHNSSFQTCSLILVFCLVHSDQMSLSSVMLSSAGEYTGTVTVTASGVYGGGGSQPACPTKTSDPVTLTIQSKAWNVINEVIIFTMF